MENYKVGDILCRYITDSCFELFVITSIIKNNLYCVNYFTFDLDIPSNGTWSLKFSMEKEWLLFEKNWAYAGSINSLLPLKGLISRKDKTYFGNAIKLISSIPIEERKYVIGTIFKAKNKK